MIKMTKNIYKTKKIPKNILEKRKKKKKNSIRKEKFRRTIKMREVFQLNGSFGSSDRQLITSNLLSFMSSWQN